MEKILVIGPTPPPHHGVSIATEALLQRSEELGFEILHLELADRRGIAFVGKADFHDVCLFLRQLVSLTKLLIRRRPRVSYLALSQTAIGFFRDSILLILCRLLGSRVVIHLHGGNFDNWYRGRNVILKFYVRRVLALVRLAVVLDEKFGEIFDGLIDRARIRVVPNGVERSEGLSHSGVDHKESQDWIVLYLGNLNRRKGAFFLLEAAGKVIQKRKDVRFVFAGLWSNTAEEAAAQSLMESAGLSSFVDFAGLVQGQEKWELLDRADLFVFPGQQQEGQPISLLEAMVSGLPVLFTDRGCVKETVEPGKGGLEVNGENPEDLASKISWMLDHPDESSRMGSNAAARARRHYSLNAFVDRMATVFREALGSH